MSDQHLTRRAILKAMAEALPQLRGVPVIVASQGTMVEAVYFPGNDRSTPLTIFRDVNKTGAPPPGLFSDLE